MKKLIGKKYLTGVVLTLFMLVANTQSVFAGSLVQGLLETMPPEQWLVALLGGTIFVLFLLFCVLSLVFYTVIITAQRQSKKSVLS